MKRIFSCFTAIMLLVTLFNITALNVSAKENMIPNYEVKLLLDSDQVLNSDDLLKKTYRNLFNTGKDYQEIGVLYIDTDDLAFEAEGWTNRIRRKEDSDSFDLTYKKRYSVENGNIDAALTKANNEGFDISDTNYDAQIDWGYGKMTLSLSCKKTASAKDYSNMELPGKKKAISILKDKMPGKLEDWKYNNWGKDTIEDGRKYGPIYYCKYGGNFNGIDVDIEIWPIYNKETQTTEMVTEISFKSDTFTEAAEYRAELIAYLDELGILLHTDSLKTQKILSNY